MGSKEDCGAFDRRMDPQFIMEQVRFFLLDLVDEDTSSILYADTDSDVSANACIFHGCDNLVAT